MATLASGRRWWERATEVSVTAVAAGACAALLARRHRPGPCHAHADRLRQSDMTRHHLNLAHQQRLHWELLKKAIDDPDLAQVLDVFDPPPPADKLRQYLFANALYTNALFYHRIGNISRSELFGYMRGLLQNQTVREYWIATRGQRATLRHGSDEAEIGHMIDDLLQELEDADSDEWWVVGTPPESGESPE
ncbi:MULTISPECIES: DUF6082 family protein [unclassified Streptomyces]|uniref:DUF6082 family protein n=1 Tax=unclassified Streptomyces TaxID=2593676 RepID=UPI001927F490|nr:MULTISPECIES: DUF6082 family protein [unclassified Streptomyces]